MALSEIELNKCETAIHAFLEKRRPPLHIRDKLDIDCRIDGKNVEVQEIRPDWQDESMKIYRSSAKATYVQATKEWKIYWMRQDLKWHRYEPYPTAKSLDEFLMVVDQDANCCFFG